MTEEEQVTLQARLSTPTRIRGEIKIEKAKPNEREFGGKLKSWGDQYLRYGGTSFSKFEIESGIKVTGLSGKSAQRFPDLHLYRLHDNARAFIFSLKTPSTAYDDPGELKKTATESGSSQYFVTWNMRDAAIWRANDLGQVARYGPITSIRSADDLRRSECESEVISVLHRIIEDLSILDAHGSLAPAVPDGSFFVRQMRSAVDRQLPLVQEEAHKLHRSSNARLLDTWAVRQGVSLNNVVEIAAKQATYRLFAQILFYFALRRTFSFLKPLADDSGNIINAIRKGFEQASTIDYQAVFKPDDILDTISTPLTSATILGNLIQNFEHYDFQKLTQDVLGQVFEGLIPAEERHRLGQYFTDEKVAQIITRITVRDSKAIVLDPTCGTGTFLLAAYDTLQINGVPHAEVVQQIWGVDIAPFPAELATINIHRRDMLDRVNFPRILVRDVSSIWPGQIVSLPLASPDALGATEAQLPFPRADAIIGNLPFISFNDLSKYEPNARANLLRSLARMWFSKYPALFDVAKHLGDEIKRGQSISTLTNEQLDLIQARIDKRADYYVYLLAHCVGLLSDDGEAALITSTSWMDAGFASDAERFLMTVGRLRYVLASYVEPWFTSVSVNVAVAGISRSGETDRVNFVSMTQPTDTYTKIENAVYAATHHPTIFTAAANYPRIATTTYRQDNVPLVIREVGRSELERSPKWVRFLRAPEIVLQIEEELFDKLTNLENEGAVVRRGTKTGLDAFFYVDSKTVEAFGIELDYLKPVLKSPVPCIRPLSEHFSWAFVCDKSLAELRQTGSNGAIAYINSGSAQTTGSTPWPLVPSLQPKISQGKHWYSLPLEEFTRIGVPLAFDSVMRHHYSETPFLINQRLTGVSLSEPTDELLLAAYLNSSLGLLFTETYGRTVLGQGALDFPREDLANHLPIPKLAHLRRNTHAIEEAFLKLIGRRTLDWGLEATSLGRAELDNAILQALASKASPSGIRDGVLTMVTQRKRLATLRTIHRRGRVVHDYDIILRRVIDRLPFAKGLRKFPSAYYSGTTKVLAPDISASQVSLTRLLGHIQLTYNSSTIILERNACAFALYSLASESRLLIAEDVDDAVSFFEAYLDECTNQLRAAVTEIGLPDSSASLESDASKETGLAAFIKWRTALS